MRRFKRKLKNIIIGWTFAIAFVACVAAVASIGEPGFAWDRLPAVFLVAGLSLTYIALVAYANSDSCSNKSSTCRRGKRAYRHAGKRGGKRTA